MSSTAVDAACLRLPLTAYPGFNRFTLDWMTGNEIATQFLERRRPAGWTAAGSAASDELTNALIASNRNWGRNVDDEVLRWSRGETFTVIAGQQVGFAGGPIYTLAKLAGMLKLKRDNEARGIPTTVFFWLATEDHDFAEVATLSLPKRDPKQQLDLTTFRARRTDSSKIAVGGLPIPEELTTALIEYLDIPRPSWLREGITFRDSFAELLTTAVDGKFILVDALLPELRRAGAPLFDGVLKNWDSIQHALDARAEALTNAGYAPQVVPRPGERHTLLFELDGHGRRHLIESPREIAPERTSTSALTRPLLQDLVLRPDLFVGGPSEVAYYAQIAPLHEMLAIPMPRVALRAHEMLAPKRLARTAARYGIKPEEIFGGADAILATREPAGVAEVKAIAEKAKRALAADITRIGEIALPAEHALARAINRSIGHIEYHFGKLTERAIRGLARKDRERYAAIRELVSTLVPDGAPQDRVTGWFGYFQQYGQHLVSQMIDEAKQDEAVCKVVSL